MRIAYITAGAASMYCGSCLHDNTLATALIAQGHEALLIPTYTPIKTDEPDVSQKRVFFGGINVFLQQKIGIFRHTPWSVDRLLDARWLLRWVSRFAMRTQAELLGDLTVSMVKGEHGYQRKEVAKLADWLADDVKPQIVHLTNVILSGMVHEIKRKLNVPVLGELQGDDIFLEALPEPSRSESLKLIREHCREFDGFLATSTYYADFMSTYLEIPRERIDVVYPGLNLTGHGSPRPELREPPYTIGYFARICPEKGLHNLVEAFRLLREFTDVPPCRLRISGFLGDNNRAYFDDLRNKLKQWKLTEHYEHIESPDLASKVRFLQSLDILSVPTVYREPKGLYILEALANGVPVVQPRHGSFPELIETTGGGLLVEPNDPADLARGLRQLLLDTATRREMGAKGKEAVHQRFNAANMARQTIDVYKKYVSD